MNIEKESLLLYAVTDRHWLAEGEPLSHAVQQALEGGATLVQIREKNLEEGAFEQEAIELQDLCRRYHVPFIVNDNVELALRIGADGIHVGQEDMEAGRVREMLGPDRILGVSRAFPFSAEVTADCYMIEIGGHISYLFHEGKKKWFVGEK